MKSHKVRLAGLGPACSQGPECYLTGYPFWEHWVTPGDRWAESALPASIQATLDLCLGWSRSVQQKHVLKEAGDVNISNDRAKEEVPK